MPTPRQNLKRRILRERGLTQGKYGKLIPEPHTGKVSNDSTKTLAMRQIEARLGKPIEVLLSMNRTQEDIARLLGIDRSTVSVWRLRLGIRDATETLNGVSPMESPTT